MDSFSVTDKVATDEFNLVKDILKKECKIPIKYCIGNHDLWGWDKQVAGQQGKKSSGRKKAGS